MAPRSRSAGWSRLDCIAPAHVARLHACLDALVEMPEYGLMSAGAAIEQAKQLDGAAPGLFAERRVHDLGEEALVAHHVGPREEHHAIAGLAVAARASDLLVPRFDTARHVAMGHVAHLGLVDPHAERDGRDDHVEIAARE